MLYAVFNLDPIYDDLLCKSNDCKSDGYTGTMMMMIYTYLLLRLCSAPQCEHPKWIWDAIALSMNGISWNISILYKLWCNGTKYEYFMKYRQNVCKV